VDEHPIRAVLSAYCQGRRLTMASVSQLTAMASGINVASNPNPDQLQSLDVKDWPT